MGDKCLCFNDVELEYLSLAIEELINRDIMDRYYHDFSRDERKYLEKLLSKINAELYD